MSDADKKELQALREEARILRTLVSTVEKRASDLWSNLSRMEEISDALERSIKP